MSETSGASPSQRMRKLALLQDIDSCEMQLSYSKRLHYQQLKGMSNRYKILDNLKINLSYFDGSATARDVHDFNKGSELDNDSALETQSNAENEGENLYSVPIVEAFSPTPSTSSVLGPPSKSGKDSKTDMDISCNSLLDNDLDSLLNNVSPIFKNHNSGTGSLSDRYIPARKSGAWQKRFSLLPDSKTNYKVRRCRHQLAQDGIKDVHPAYSNLLKNELLDADIDCVNIQSDEKKTNSPLGNLFQYSSPERKESTKDFTTAFSLSPVGPSSQKLLRSPRKATRKISGIPYKVLDAPELQDDFYLNLVDWSSQNILSVGLGRCVYLWSATTGQVTRLCDFTQDQDYVTSVSWNERGNLCAVGTHNGYVQIWDVTANKRLCKYVGHSARIGALSWCGDLLASGSRDRTIILRDIKNLQLNRIRRLTGHRQEVCGLKWSPDNQHLASGGNDNKLYVWNMHSLTPVHTFTEHRAAVKAIAWSPHHHGLLASGGGTADRCIRFWNTLTGTPMNCFDTCSQICNLAWSKHSSELVSTHGYSQNQIVIWKYPSMTQVAKLTGHSYRVLYLSMSPDGESIVTGAGDETLRFWNVFSKVRSQKENKSVLNLYGNIR